MSQGAWGSSFPLSNYWSIRCTLHARHILRIHTNTNGIQSWVWATQKNMGHESERCYSGLTASTNTCLNTPSPLASSCPEDSDMQINYLITSLLQNTQEGCTHSQRPSSYVWCCVVWCDVSCKFKQQQCSPLQPWQQLVDSVCHVGINTHSLRYPGPFRFDYVSVHGIITDL